MTLAFFDLLKGRHSNRAATADHQEWVPWVDILNAIHEYPKLPKEFCIVSKQDLKDGAIPCLLTAHTHLCRPAEESTRYVCTCTPEGLFELRCWQRSVIVEFEARARAEKAVSSVAQAIL